MKSFVIEILGRLPLFFGEGPLARDEAKVDGFDVTVGELDLRTRGVPHLFGSDPEFARFDAFHEIAAGDGKHGIGVTLRRGRGEATGLGEFFGHHEPLRERGSHGDAGLLGGMRFEQRGQLLAGAGVGLVSGRFAGGPFDAVEIDEGPRRSVGVARVKTQEVLVKRDRTQLRRGGVGRLRFPGEEFRHRAKGRRFGVEREGILRGGSGLLGGGVKGQRFVDEEVVEGRAEPVGHVALLQQGIVVGDGDLPQHFRVFEGRPVARIDLGEEAWQVPGLEILARRFGRGGALENAPAILLEVIPVGPGEERLQDGRDFCRGVGEGGFIAADRFLRLMPLDL